jgi:hypothetical protein
MTQLNGKLWTLQRWGQLPAAGALPHCLKGCPAPHQAQRIKKGDHTFRGNGTVVAVEIEFA